MRSLECKAWELKDEVMSPHKWWVSLIVYTDESIIKEIVFDHKLHGINLVFTYNVTDDTFAVNDIVIPKIPMELLNDMNSKISEDIKCEDCVFNFQRKLNKCQGHFFVKNKCKKNDVRTSQFK
jgi:hypothetical protein